MELTERYTNTTSNRNSVRDAACYPGIDGSGNLDNMQTFVCFGLWKIIIQNNDSSTDHVMRK